MPEQAWSPEGSQRSCWFVEGHRCPECGGELCTEGRFEWCSRCTYGHRKPRRLQLIEGGVGGESAEEPQEDMGSMSDKANCQT